MNIFLEKDRYKKENNTKFCQNPECKIYSDNLQFHHIYHRRNSDLGIWLCFDCHRKTHDSPKWAKKIGILKIPTNKTPKRSKKIKKCKRHKAIFDKDSEEFICQFCKKVIKTFDTI